MVLGQFLGLRAIFLTMAVVMVRRFPQSPRGVAHQALAVTPYGHHLVMIASREKAPRYGPGRLVVDGHDRVVHRRTTFAFNPSKRQEGELHRLLAACREVYNAGLQERRDAWRLAGQTITVVDQFKALTELRGIRDDVLVWGVQPLRGTLRRLDDAFAAFFRRARNGQVPGFPRFKGARRFNTVCWDEPVSWKADPQARTLYLQGVGVIRLPKSARRQLQRLLSRGGVPVTLTVTRRRAGTGWVWRATVGFKQVACEPTVPANGDDSIVGGDRGVKVTLATSDGDLHTMPAWMAEARDRIVDLQRQRASKQKFSRAWRGLNRRIAREYRKVSRRADNWARETANVLVAAHGVIALEELNLAAMTRSAKGTVEEPGTNVAAKAGLNRALQDAALGRLAYWVAVKAENAGRRLWLVDPAGTSIRCARCGHTDKANRIDRDAFRCEWCGHSAHADLNAAANIAALAAACEVEWAHAGSRPLTRPTPRMRRRKPGTEETAAARAA